MTWKEVEKIAREKLGVGDEYIMYDSSGIVIESHTRGVLLHYKTLDFQLQNIYNHHMGGIR